MFDRDTVFPEASSLQWCPLQRAQSPLCKRGGPLFASTPTKMVDLSNFQVFFNLCGRGTWSVPFTASDTFHHIKEYFGEF